MTKNHGHDDKNHHVHGFFRGVLQKTCILKDSISRQMVFAFGMLFAKQ